MNASYPDEALGLEDRDATPAARYGLRESRELAFVVALQQLAARQRAELILGEVLAFSAQEVAKTLRLVRALGSSKPSTVYLGGGVSLLL